jgi:hypothetical protein
VQRPTSGGRKQRVMKMPKQGCLVRRLRIEQ